MDVWRITLAAFRRWYVLLPMLAVTGVLVMLSGSSVAPEYEAQASGMLTPERAQVEIANPYGSITGANEALGIVLSSVDTRRAVMEQGLAASYEIGTQSRSTIFQMTIRADTPEVAVATGQAVLDLAVQELATRQTEAGLPADGQYTLSVLEPPAVIAVVGTSAVRVQAVVGVLGAGLSLLVAVLFDDIVGLWRRSRDKRRGPGRRQAAAEALPDADHDDLPRIERVDRVSRAAKNGAELSRRSKSRVKSQRQAATRRQTAQPTEPGTRAEKRDESTAASAGTDSDERIDPDSLRRSGWIGPHGEHPRKAEDEPDRSEPSGAARY